MKKIIFLVTLIILMSGCSYKEINELAIANSIGIDYIDDKYVISAQVMDLTKSQKDNSTEENTILYIGSGDSIPDAIRDITLKYPNTLYLGHLELMIVGKGMLEEGIDKTFDYFMRSPEARNDSLLIVSDKFDAKEILNPNKESKESFPTKDIITTIENSMERNGSIEKVTFEDFVSNYLKKGMDPILPIIELSKSPTKDYKNNTIKKMALFRDKKYLGSIDSDVMIVYNTLKNNYSDIIIVENYKNSKVSSVLINPSSSYDIKIKDNKPVITFNIKVESQLIDVYEKIDLTKDKNIRELNNLLNNKMKKYVNDFVNFSIENNVDILGIKNKMYKHYKKEYDNYKNKNIYKEAKLDINVDIKLFRYGNANRNSTGGNL